jgi:hypothetical protein
MENRVARLESTIAHLRDNVADLEARIAVLEGRAGVQAQTTAEGDLAAESVPDLRESTVQQWLGLIGRTLVILGGAYLLRALTESHVVTAPVGVALGLVYGAPWLALGSRAGARGAHLDALCHALATALIGYPLVWEATVRFSVLSPIQSAALLAALTAGALVLAFTRRLHELAWVVTFGALASALTLAIATGSWIAYTVFTIAVGIGTLWLGYTREWIVLRWPAAFVANFMLFIVTGRAAVHGGARIVLAVQLLMLGGYLGSFAMRTLVLGREVIPFEVAQSVGVLAFAFGGAIYLIHATDSNVMPVGLASLALAVAGYHVAFAFVERRRHVKNFFFYTLLALVFALTGVPLCFGVAAGAVLYSTTAVGTALLARRHHRLTLALHAMAYALAGGSASGLLTTATLAVAAPAQAGWTTPGPTAWIALASLVFVTVWVVRQPVEHWGAFAHVPRLVLVFSLVWTVAGTAIATMATIAGDPRQMDPAVLATLRTAVLVLVTLGAARAARLDGGREAGWLIYPLLTLTGLKLLFVDFPLGRPQTLFAALALYGLALIAGPRLMRTGNDKW